jgi:hypothetical protein
LHSRHGSQTTKAIMRSPKWIIWGERAGEIIRMACHWMKRLEKSSQPIFYRVVVKMCGIQKDEAGDVLWSKQPNRVTKVR